MNDGKKAQSSEQSLAQALEALTPLQQQIANHLRRRKHLLLRAISAFDTLFYPAAFLALLPSVDLSLPSVQGLIIVPTREHVFRMYRLLRATRESPGARILCTVGGTNIQQSIELLNDVGVPIHVVIGTCGRIHDLMRRGVLKLDPAASVWVDEIDDTLSRSSDMKVLLREIFDLLPDPKKEPSQLQIIIWSITMCEETRAFLRTALRDVQLPTISVHWDDMQADRATLQAQKRV